MWLLIAALGWLAFAPLAWRALQGNTDAIRMLVVEPALTIVGCLLVATAVPGFASGVLDRLHRFLDRVARFRVSWLATALMLVVASGLAWYCFGGQPAISDEFAQRLQARLLLAGRLSAVPESLDAFFNTVQTGQRDGRWFTVFPIGGPALHAIGESIGLGWMINPLLAAATAFLLHRFTAAVYGKKVAALTVILLLASPFVLVMSASQINHPKALAAQMLALTSLVAWESYTDGRGQRASAALIGSGIGLLASIRPFDAVLIALPIALFQLRSCIREPKRWASVAVQVAVALAFVAIVLGANARTTGHPLLFAYDLINGPAHGPGFHTDPLGHPFTPIRGLATISQYLMRLNTALFETPVPAMAFVIGAIALVRRPTRWDYLLLGLMVSTLAGYGVYWFNGDYFGPRFLYPALPAFLILCARFPALIRDRFSGRPALARAGQLLLPVALVVAWLPASLVGRQRGVLSRLALVAGTPGTNQVDAEELAHQAGLTNALVFVREPVHSTLSAQLRALGALPYTAERIVGDLDACTLMSALAATGGRADAAELSRVVDEARRAGPAAPVPGLIGARALALASGRPPTPECSAALAKDGQGTAAYGAFAAQNHFDGQGRRTGEVIFVRDLGPGNERLRARFPDRVWYRYLPDGDRPGASGRFVRLSENEDLGRR